MPCRDDVVREDDSAALKKEIDRVTRLLCEAGALIRAAGITPGPALSEWLARHARADQLRAEEAAKAAKRAAVKAAALAKLSKKERRLLDLD